MATVWTLSGRAGRPQERHGACGRRTRRMPVSSAVPMVMGCAEPWATRKPSGRLGEHAGIDERPESRPHLRRAGHARSAGPLPVQGPMRLHAMERLTGRIGRWNDRNDRGPEIRRTRIAFTAFSQARWCPDTPAAARVVRGPVGQPRAGAAVRLRAALVDGLRQSPECCCPAARSRRRRRFAVSSVQRRFPGRPSERDVARGGRTGLPCDPHGESPCGSSRDLRTKLSMR